MNYKDFVALYELDKRVCQMICDVEKLSKSFVGESANLLTYERRAKDDEAMQARARAQKQKYQEFLESGRKLVRELFAFKKALVEYQSATSEARVDDLEFYFGSERVEEYSKEEDCKKEGGDESQL